MFLQCIRCSGRMMCPCSPHEWSLKPPVFKTRNFSWENDVVYMPPVFSFMVGLCANKVWANCCQSHCKVARSHCASPTLPELQRPTIMRNKVPKVPISWKSRVHLFWQATNKISFATTWQHGWGTASKAQAIIQCTEQALWGSSLEIFNFVIWKGILDQIHWFEKTCT